MLESSEILSVVDASEDVDARDEVEPSATDDNDDTDTGNPMHQKGAVGKNWTLKQREGRLLPRRK